MGQVNLNLNDILGIFSFKISATGILMQRKCIILEYIFLPHKLNKKFKMYVEKVSKIIILGKLKLIQLAGIYSAEIIVPLLVMGLKNYRKIMNAGKDAVQFFRSD